MVSKQLSTALLNYVLSFSLGYVLITHFDLLKS